MSEIKFLGVGYFEHPDGGDVRMSVTNHSTFEGDVLVASESHDNYGKNRAVWQAIHGLDQRDALHEPKAFFRARVDALRSVAMATISAPHDGTGSEVTQFEDHPKAVEALRALPVAKFEWRGEKRPDDGFEVTHGAVLGGEGYAPHEYSDKTPRGLMVLADLPTTARLGDPWQAES